MSHFILFCSLLLCDTRRFNSTTLVTKSDVVANLSIIYDFSAARYPMHVPPPQW